MFPAIQATAQGDIEMYFSGRALYGDDLSPEEIARWYEDEKEGYAALVDAGDRYRYGYHAINQLYGYRYLPPGRDEKVLGVGSAAGYEFLPIQDRLGQLYILEPSEQLASSGPGDLGAIYQKPRADGYMDFPDDTFDLIVCLDTLHHIPNVSRVCEEMARCLKSGGYLLCREPIHSMGDWRRPRPGLTARERGIPLEYFRKKIPAWGLEVVRESLFFTMTSFLTRKTARLLPRPLYTYRSYLRMDRWLSRLLRDQVIYHPRSRWQRIAPSEVFYVLTK